MCAVCDVEDEEIPDMRWTQPQFSTRKQVDRSGQTVAQFWDSWAGHEDEVYKALTIIGNWRSCHGYPLYAVRTTLRRRAKAIDPMALVFHRLKRLPSIVSKLNRHGNRDMKLSQMHDIGGCRAVMPTISGVANLVSNYNHANPDARMYDYVDAPKEDGYRSVHFQLKYQGRAEKTQIYNNFRIEVQIRSQFQHAWATAVETVDTITGQALKSNVGDERWKRFFALASSALALMEGCGVVPGCPLDEKELANELRSLSDQLNTEAALRGFGAAMKQHFAKVDKANLFLVVLDTANKSFGVTGYTQSDVATDEYLRLEKEHHGKPSIQTVLVSVDSIHDLKAAYPNYELDSSGFLGLLESWMERQGV